MSEIIKVDNVSFKYNSEDNHEALSNVTFDIHHGEWISIIGPNGSGQVNLAGHQRPYCAWRDYGRWLPAQ